jgi:hypothetical protein
MKLSGRFGACPPRKHQRHTSLGFWHALGSAICRPAALIALCLAAGRSAAGVPLPERPRFEPLADVVYLQETARRVETSDPLWSLAVFEDELYAGGPLGVVRLDGDRLVPTGGPAGSVRRLKVFRGALWAVGEAGLWRLGEGHWSTVDERRCVDCCLHRGDVVFATPDQLYRLEGPVSSPHAVGLIDGGSRAPILGVESHAETLYLRHGDRLGLIEQGRAQYYAVQDWGSLPLASRTRDMLSLGDRLAVATDNGLALLRGMSWQHVTGKEGLCYEDTTCLADGCAREKGDFWIGTTRGAIRALKDGSFHYFGSDRWIPHERVHSIVCGPHCVYLATEAGLGIIEYQPYTLRKKAVWYERWLDEWGQKRLGFVHNLIRDPQRGTYRRFLSDNDVGWVAHYLSALSFQYAVSGDRQVRAQAVDVFKAVKWSDQITPLDGFPARAIHAVGADEIKSTTGSGGLPAEWNPTEDGQWEWKGDTSSDEVDAHVYAVSLFLELAAEGQEEEAARNHLQRILGHIVDNGWVLRDLDGQPTRWARWDPEYLQRPYGFNARGLNGMEALSYMATGIALTGDLRFTAGKRQLLDWGYHREVLRQKQVFPIITHFDDRLAFLAYDPLLRYETDPELRSIYRRSAERSWEVKRIEGLPWFNFLYSAWTGHDGENRRGVEHLREWPLDCIDYRYSNSHRHDLAVPRGYRNYVADHRPLSPRDVGPQRWDHNFHQLDGGGGRGVLDPTGWLEAYWMGRYYGIIGPPATTEPGLLSVEGPLEQRGAAPYQGPPRPEVFDF